MAFVLICCWIDCDFAIGINGWIWGNSGASVGGIYANPQADGIAILSLTPNVKPLEFIPSFRRVFSFTPDGRESAMLKYNSDFS
ncbi:MAG: hypothetical protein LH628_17925 [Microcoleus sp. CAN_BIN18]|nr:hypothetical protein [Microcoleus sp. CAN_BIN18]